MTGGRFARLSPRHGGDRTEPTMAAVFNDFSGSVRRWRSYRSAQKATRSARRTGLDLVGRAHQFYKSGKSERTIGKPEPGNRQIEILRRRGLSARLQQTTAFDDLPRDHARNSQANITNGQNGALQDDCVNHARIQIKRMERDPNLS